MAQHVEPMDIDTSECDFDDKENAFHHNNALPRTPCTEKGYEELDVSELNMKLRYSVTPAASPMSKSYDIRNNEDNALDGENANMTRSLNTTLTKNDTIIKTQKLLPLQTLSTDLSQISDGNRNVLRPLDTTVTVDNNITVTVSGPNYIDENISLPSSSSSMTHTPEATTPTKEIPKSDGGSPIIRGLKNVLNMFRPSQSPIPGEEDMAKLETLSPPIVHSPETSRDDKKDAVSASTPIVGHKTKEPLMKKNSPNRENLVFNEDLEKELEWKDDSTILFSNEKIPIHKLFFQQPKCSYTKRTIDLTKSVNNKLEQHIQKENLNATVEYMDISYNDSGIMDKTATTSRLLSDLNKSEVSNTESDSEFVDCESTFTKNDSFIDKNELNSTEDVLSLINNLVEAKNLNASVQTLNASDPKSANLSTASTETTKQNYSQHIVGNPAQEEKKEEIQAEDTINAAVSAVSDIIIDQNSHVIEPVTNNITNSESITENNDTVIIHSPVLENIVVKSLYQIPLIVDPSVLLFNITSVNDSENKHEGMAVRNLNTLPADIPLPEDDDIPSLPVMNSELENLTHTLDKIAEEIPKINQHESSVSSVDFSDNKSISDNVASSEERETVLPEIPEDHVLISENTGPQSVICPKVKVPTDLEKQEDIEGVNYSVVNESIPTDEHPPTKAVVALLPADLIEGTKSPIVIPTDIQNLVDNVNLPIDIKSEVKNIMLPGGITGDIKSSGIIPSAIETPVEKTLLPAEIKSEVPNIALPADIPLDTKEPVVIHEIETIQDTVLAAENELKAENFALQAGTEITKGSVATPTGIESVLEVIQASEIKPELENVVPPAGITEDTKVPMDNPTEIEDLVEKAILPAKIKSKVEDTSLLAEINIECENNELTTVGIIEHRKVPVDTPVEIQTLVENFVFPTESLEDIGAPVPTPNEIKTVVENTVAANLSFVNMNMPVSISHDPSTGMNNTGEILKDVSSSVSVALPTENRSEINNAISIAETVTQKVQEVEPMDISMTDIQETADINKIQAMTEEVANIGAPIFEPGVTSDKTQPEDLENTGEQIITICKIYSPTEVNYNSILDTVLGSKIPETFKCLPDNNMQDIECNIEIIKQEVEAIVEKAIDIAIERSNANSSGTMTDVENKNDNTVVVVAADIENEVKDLIEQKESINDHLNVFQPYALKETAGIICDEKANDQQISLNQLSDNKYSYTVQDNVPDSMMTHNTVTSVIVNKDADTTDQAPTETPAVSNGTNGNNITTTVNDKEMDVDLQPENAIKEDKILDVTPPDMVKIERVEKADKEITVSENNSPFVLVSHELGEPVEVKSTENFDDIEYPCATKSKVVKTPPASPTIVSKGYNFNFDEIDDPFATKTKIRISPGPDASPTQSFEQIDVDEEPSKKEVNKNYRRRSQPDRKRTSVSNKKMNSAFSGKSSSGNKPIATEIKSLTSQTSAKLQKVQKYTDPKECTKETTENFTNQDVTEKEETVSQSKSRDITQDVTSPIIEESVSIVSCEFKGTSLSEQSTHFSAVTSDEVIEVKTEIKTPDFDNQNLNPFASKSKIRQSPPPENAISPFATKSRVCQTPPPSLNSGNPFETKSKIRTSPEPSLGISKETEMSIVGNSSNTESLTELSIDQKGKKYEMSTTNININLETPVKENNAVLEVPEEKESAENISITTCSSNNDKESTVREINTEDEDTVEGPFLEVEDLQNYDKMSDFDGENIDMMQFSELPPSNEENPDAGELFIDAEAFDFLLNQNNTNTVTDSGKESLFLKFDPLFAKRISSDGVMAALKQVKVKQSTPIKDKKPPIPRDATFDKETPILKDATFNKKPPILRDATFNKESLILRDATFNKESPILRDATFDEETHIPRDATFGKTSPSAGPSGLNVTQEIDFNSTAEESYEDLNVTVSKPMMVVNPAVNPVVTPRNKTITPVRSNRQSLTFTSPAIAVIDRLLFMNASNNSFMAHDTTIAETRRDNEADLALTQLRELLADKEISVCNLRSETKELQGRLATLESQVKSLESISEEKLKKINELNEKLNEKTQINKNMAKVVEEYERTIASLIAETEQDKKRHAEERLQLIKERDEQTAHLASMEVSFSDLHSKYEKSKQVIIGFKTNEDAYKKSIKEFEENLAKMQKNYELLKQHATSKLNYANEELQKINRAHEAEVLKMNAMIKRKELHITSLEETLQQKTKANEELTAICDELINKVG